MIHARTMKGGPQLHQDFSHRTHTHPRAMPSPSDAHPWQPIYHSLFQLVGKPSVSAKCSGENQKLNIAADSSGGGRERRPPQQGLDCCTCVQSLGQSSTAANCQNLSNRAVVLYVAEVVCKTAKRGVREWCPSTIGPLLPTMTDSLLAPGREVLHKQYHTGELVPATILGPSDDRDDFIQLKYSRNRRDYENPSAPLSVL